MRALPRRRLAQSRQRASRWPVVLLLALVAGAVGCDLNASMLGLSTGDTGGLPAAPTNLNAAAVSLDPAVTSASGANKAIVELQLSWDDNANNEDGFSVRSVNVDAGSAPFPASTLPANVVQPVDYGPLECGTTYAVMVSAFNDAGASAEACLQVTLPACTDVTQPATLGPCTSVQPAAAQPAAQQGQSTSGGQQSTPGQSDSSGNCGAIGDGQARIYMDCANNRCLSYPSDLCGNEGQPTEVGMIACGDPATICGGGNCGSFGDGQARVAFDCTTNRCLSYPKDLCGNEGQPTEVGVIACGDPATICGGSSQGGQCGDGNCDPGEDANSCSSDCNPMCGNGVPEPGESCDGNVGCANNFVCDANCDCIFNPPYNCGDLNVEPGEQCDGSDSPCLPNGRCDNSTCLCFTDTATCGDGFVEWPEECDGGDWACSDSKTCGADCLCH